MAAAQCQAVVERAQLDFERAELSVFVPRYSSFDVASIYAQHVNFSQSGGGGSGSGPPPTAGYQRKFIIQGERVPLILIVTPGFPRAQLIDDDGSLDSDVFQSLKISVQPRIKTRYYSATTPALSFAQTIFEKSPFYSHDSLQNFPTPKIPSEPSSSDSTPSSSDCPASDPVRNCYLQRQTTVLQVETRLPNGAYVYRVDVPLALSIAELSCQVALFLSVEPVQHAFGAWGPQSAAISPLRRLTVEQELASLLRSGGLAPPRPAAKKVKLNVQLLQPLQCDMQTSQSCGRQFITVQLENMFQRDRIVIEDVNLQLAETFFVPLLSHVRSSSAPQLTLSLSQSQTNLSLLNAATASPLASGNSGASLLGSLFPSASLLGSADGSLPASSPARNPLDALQIGEATPVDLDALFRVSLQKPALPLTLLPGDQFTFVVSLEPLPSYTLSVGMGFFKSNMLVSWTTPASFDMINCRRDVIWANPFYGNCFLLYASCPHTRHDVDAPFLVDFLVSNMSDKPAGLSLVFGDPTVDADAYSRQSLVPLQPKTDLGVVPAHSSVALQVPFVGFERGVHELRQIYVFEHETNRSFALIHPLTFLIDDPQP